MTDDVVAVSHAVIIITANFMMASSPVVWGGAAGFSFFGETAVANVGSTVNSCCTVAADDDSMVGEVDHFSSPLASQPTV